MGKILKTKALGVQELRELVIARSLPGRYQYLFKISPSFQVMDKYLVFPKVVFMINKLIFNLSSFSLYLISLVKKFSFFLKIPMTAFVYLYFLSLSCFMNMHTKSQTHIHGCSILQNAPKLTEFIFQHGRQKLILLVPIAIKIMCDRSFYFLVPLSPWDHLP